MIATLSSNDSTESRMPRHEFRAFITTAQPQCWSDCDGKHRQRAQALGIRREVSALMPRGGQQLDFGKPATDDRYGRKSRLLKPRPGLTALSI